MTFAGKVSSGTSFDTPLTRKPGFSTTDGCWLFDEIEGDVRSAE